MLKRVFVWLIIAATTTGAAQKPAASDPAALVNPFIGTAGGGNTFPGAVMPFGMLSWSPETTRGDATRVAAPGGYHHEFPRVRGFSLTHLSGTGCRGASGDIPFMPHVGEVASSPSADVKNAVYASTFDHANESASPGAYRVRLDNGVDVELTATERTGIGRFTYPADRRASMLVRTSDTQIGSGDAMIAIDVPGREISGSVTSGNFCGYLHEVNRHDYYTLYFAATFDRPFKAIGTWKDGSVEPGGLRIEGGTSYGTDGYPVAGKGSGGWVELDLASGQAVTVRVGISYVSVEGARANLRAEQPRSITLEQVRTKARQTWNEHLRRIEIMGGSDAQRRIFYTALYHSLLHMNIASDVNGEYCGFDGKVHRVAAPQRVQYANFSGWDVYRAQVQLVALLEPKVAADMAQSLLNQATQNDGVWDRWTHNTGDTHVMEGDPSAPAVASIAAFGATDFDRKAALDSLVRAATVPTPLDLSDEGCRIMCPGQRPSLDKWLTLHYIPTESNSWGGAGATLEAVTADFAIGQLARQLGEKKIEAEFLERSGYWRNVFNPAPIIAPPRGRRGAPPPQETGKPMPGGYIQNRNEDGTWPALTPSASSGFAEGSSVQYTWMIPFDPHGLFDAMGGDAAALARLDAFFRRPDGSWALRNAGGLHAQMSNEPSIATPWLYHFAGRPDLAQEVLRESLRTLWKDAPDGIPGNDDLGTMSAWYVWTTLGLYPYYPGRAELLITPPLFSRAVIHRGNGRTLTIDAPWSLDGVPQVASLQVNGRPSARSWLPESFVLDGGTLTLKLAERPAGWGTAPADRPPSFATQAGPADRAALAARVRQEFLHAWNGYKRYAWGHDDLDPVSRKPRDWYPPEVLYMTPVDALDTMLLMGLTREAAEVQALILEKLSFDKDISVQVFEINIRILGGLLTAYEMTNEKRFLALAEDLGRRLLPAFKSATGMPYRFVNLETGAVRDPVSNPAEIGTLILEFGTLSRHTGNTAFFDATKKALVEVYKRRHPDTGLVGTTINVETGEWVNTSAGVGARIDSFYEYLLKCERLFADKDCGAMYRESIAAVNRHLADDAANGLWYGAADMKDGKRTRTVYGSLQAFLPGVLAMGGDLDRAKRLQDSGFRMWNLHGIEPELLDYAKMEAVSRGYQLRPEIMESAYILHHYTKDPKYIDMGRTFLEGLIAHCKVEDGYTSLRSVVTKEKADRMHSFFFAETLKYLYLLFEPKALDFETHVFNTEAHPFRIDRSRAR